MHYMRKIFQLVIALTVFCCISCGNDTVEIEPIDPEFNTQLLTGERLDPNFFSRKDILQYYQIDNYKAKSATELAKVLTDYTTLYYNTSQLAVFNQADIIFYQKKWFKDYSSHLYTLVQDNDSGFITEYKDYLIGVVSFEKIKNNSDKLIRTVRIYDPETAYKHTDTLTLHP
jgi:hypothetical protein